MFYSWMGLGLQCLEKAKEAQRYLQLSLEIGEGLADDKIIGYACTWMAMACSDLGLLDDALNYGNRALEVAKRIPLDPFLYLFSLRAVAYAYCMKGECRQIGSLGRLMLEHGDRQADNRASALGYVYIGFSHFFGGDMLSAVEPIKKGILASPDPLLSCSAKTALGAAFFLKGNLDEAEKKWVEVCEHCEQHGAGTVGSLSRAALISLYFVKGELSRGAKMAEELLEWHEKNENKWRLAYYLCWSANVYLKISQGKGSTDLSFVARNFGFLVRNILVAGRKAEEYFNRSIEVSKQIGAIAILGQAYLGLGLLYETRGRNDLAGRYILDAIEAFEECGAEGYLKQAREALATCAI
jgi:tetratricopeptide (TPR) repeat protein